MEDRVGLRSRVFGEERAILVGVLEGRDEQAEREMLSELIALSKTANIEVLRVITQRRSRPDASTYIGDGKAKQIRDIAHEVGADAIIFNESLSPAQGRNLEELMGIKIIDRSQLILDIFAQRAQSKEARLQVELAQLEYLRPRLRGWGEALGQLGAGIGTRGPGETKLELERQGLKRRIHRIKKRLAQSSVERNLRRRQRSRRAIPEIALVGYTNTGKSTLLQALSGADTLIENKLFATLDPRARKVKLPKGREVVFIDTVGFIRKLPHQLVSAFHSTLETAKNADLILNILDISNRSIFEQFRTIQEILKELYGNEPRPPMLNVLNKVDQLETPEDYDRLERAKFELQPLVEISAKERINFNRLFDQVSEMINVHSERVCVEIPYSERQLVGKLHGWGEIYEERYEQDKIIIEALLDEGIIASLEKASSRNGINLTRPT